MGGGVEQSGPGRKFSTHSTSGRPAPFASIPDPKVMHWRDLHPDKPSLMIDPETGEDKTPPTRTGGMFSVRRLALVNTINPNQAVAFRLVPTSLRPQEWPIAKHQRVSNPAVYPQDKEEGNVEIQFDFREELVAYAEAYNAKNIVELDPLKKNDLAPGQFPPGFEPGQS